MSAPIMEQLGIRRVLEGFVEYMLPLALGLILFLWTAWRLGTPGAGRTLQGPEVFFTLLPAIASSSWAAGRVAFGLNLRSPRLFALLSLTITAGGLGSLSPLSQLVFAEQCARRGGQSLAVSPSGVPEGDGSKLPPTLVVCQLTGTRPTPLLPGTLLRPPWNGALAHGRWIPVLLTGFALLTILGTRDRRLARSHIAQLQWSTLRLAPAAGSASGMRVAGTPPRSLSDWQACANPTLWGELCGQLYTSDYVFAEGEPCVRCGLLFRPSPRVELAVVSLRLADIDYLNTLDSREARIWRQGDAQPPSQETSEARWVSLGELSLPDVLTVGQTISLVLEWLSQQETEEHSLVRASELCRRQASRLAAWFWFHPDRPSLEHGIPTRDVHLATATQRLRDVLGGRSGWKALQLEVGIVPIDLCVGLYRPPESRAGADTSMSGGQRFNNRQVFWLPVAAAALARQDGGRWVPRVEGAGLRLWLTLTSREAIFTPAPFFWERAPWAASVRFDEPHDASRLPLALARLPAPTDTVIERSQLLGCRLSEWDWFDRRHLELLRRQSVIMAPGDLRRWGNLSGSPEEGD